MKAPRKALFYFDMLVTRARFLLSALFPVPKRYRQRAFQDWKAFCLCRQSFSDPHKILIADRGNITAFNCCFDGTLCFIDM
jgi:hypothetical protein